jgi:hypothetical protein
MNAVEGITTLLVGAFVGGIIAFQFGCWLTRHELQMKSYTQLKRERDQLSQLVDNSIQAAEIKFIHHNCIRKPAEAETESEPEEEFPDWIPD